MNRVLAVNDLIRYQNAEGENSTIRLLYIDKFNDITFVINIYGHSGLPKFFRPSALREDLAFERAQVLAEDVWARGVAENELSEKEKTIRDFAWRVIEDLVKPENEPAVYYKKLRAPLISQAAEKFQIQEKTVYKYLRRYWQRGQVKNALLPDYKNSGGRGNERTPSELKRGRKRKFVDVLQIGEGINVDENIKKIFRTAISQFYHNPKEISLRAAFNLMLKEYFVEDYENVGGVKKPVLIPPDQRPTYIQFSYWYNKEKNIEKDISSRKGRSAYSLTTRPITGSATSEVFGPGSRYELDATVADVYLVSRYNRSWIIGRPVVYIVIDVFSRLIAGVYVGLEGPSWLGAMMALVNATTNKQTFCLEYGIPIKEEQWFCHYLPDTILADGGELAGKAAESLANNLNVRIETASPYRGDLKGIVERNFRTIHERVKPFLPGQIIKDANKRRGYDYRLDAKLDIYQFTKIIILSVLQHNGGYLKSYQRDVDMIANNIQSIPVNLWNWGIENRSGRLRTSPEDIVKLNLLPGGYGRITRGGILFKNIEYSCERAIRERWFEKGSAYDSEKLPVVFDLRNPNYIYLKADDGRSFEKCYLLPTEDRYINKNFYEIEHLQNYEQLQHKLGESNTQQEFADFATITECIVAEAEEMTNQMQDPTVSKASKVANIHENRGYEKQKRRDQEAFELGKEIYQLNPQI